MCGIVAILRSMMPETELRQAALEAGKSIQHRGPDWNGIRVFAERGIAIEHERLAIIDPESGAQPLVSNDPEGNITCSVNGEIYNYKELAQTLKTPYKFMTKSDCEIIIPLYLEHGPDFVHLLRGMFSFVLYDHRKDFFLAARDHMGITPMYYGYGADGSVWFASEMKALQQGCVRFEVFPPGHVFTSDTETCKRWYNPDWYAPGHLGKTPLDLKVLREAFEASVKRRMMSDVPWGVLLSGGLDSSLVASIAVREKQKLVAQGGEWINKIHSFTIGLEDSPDLKAAQEVANFLGTIHHSYTYTIQEGLDAVSEVIKYLETYDVTTIRASTPMFLMSRKIKAMGIKMVLSGEGADEVFGGYLYFHKAPSAEAFHKETVSKLQGLHQYDCLRANKSTSAWGLEARVPFLDADFLDIAMNIDTREKMIDAKAKKFEKYIIRKAFDDKENPYLPENILWRQKEQFSDGVGYGWIDSLKDLAEKSVTDRQMKHAQRLFTYNPPQSKEAYLYRSIFQKHFQPEVAAETVPGGPSIASSLPQTREVKDKNRDFIKELEDKKRKEKEDRARHERRKKKLHEKRTRKILQDAADARRKSSSSPEVDDLNSELLRPDAPDAEPQEEDDKEVDAAAAEKQKEKVKRQKRLLKKQQAHLAKIQAKQREVQEELEMEKEREQRKREKVTQTVLNAIQDSNNRSAENAVDTDDDTDGPQQNNTAEHDKAVPERNQITPREAAPVDEQTEEQKQRAKEQREAFQRKQQEYLQKLTDQRKQKQKEEEDARLRQEKRNKKVQQGAKLRLQEAAAKQQMLAEIREKEEAEAAAAAAEKAANAGPPVDVEAMVARLSKLKDRDAQIIPEARDFASWKKRHGVGQDQKVFCMTGWYPVIREELEKRGWFYNQEKISPYFDLKWSLKSDELRHFKVEKHQYVNHFFQNAAITTKVGLIHNLRSAVWHQSVDIDEMFPRAYDLNDPSDMDSFVQDFRYGVAEGLLKELARRGLQLQKKVPGSTSIGANEALVDVVLNIARKKVKSKRPEMDCANTAALLDPLEESVDDPQSSGVGELVTDLQWEVLTNCSLDKAGHLRASLVYKKKVYTEDRMDGAVDGKGSETALSAREKRLQRHTEKIAADSFNREKARLSDLMAHVSLVKDTTFDEAIRLARKLEKLCPQFHINGGAEFMLPTLHPVAATSISKNVWIVKPAGMSRGRGIRVFNDLDQLLEYVDVENHKECQWVAQKYIENPLLVCKRKFDIRQWVLVTGWDPLTVWFNEDCYLRFSSEEYSMDDLSDQYVHLTNNSIQKLSDKFNDVYATDDGEMQVEGNMWHSDDFKKFLATKLGHPDIWNERMHPRMKEVVVQSLQCVQDMVQHRSNSCELFGYDFMVDEDLMPWLIEVNSSPACDYSTPIAKRYVESGLSGIIKVIVDHREFEQQKRSSNGTGLEEPDTGCWKRIHKAEFIGKPISSIALDFQVKGSKDEEDLVDNEDVEEEGEDDGEEEEECKQADGGGGEEEEEEGEEESDGDIVGTEDRGKDTASTDEIDPLL
ncbi:hypothetical protein JM18_005695 [Phytophthora kernoviae]|uniref:asparagine synthase (glutamine-hydrolyzing) n=1 Tax=Phytophthora kernoviae TaxID=325452 RepID=A0A8T0LX46_9STRA|nr:hypothetical protein JM16_006028 [Phytophthora kernoviae]KAG2523637.1 hypothetical protein JM18_005695 [Phytophthora kernoviae]